MFIEPGNAGEAGTEAARMAALPGYVSIILKINGIVPSDIFSAYNMPRNCYRIKIPVENRTWVLLCPQNRHPA